jgi:hypothetical protein
MYNLVYARNEMQKNSEANIGVTVMLMKQYNQHRTKADVSHSDSVLLVYLGLS